MLLHKHIDSIFSQIKSAHFGQKPYEKSTWQVSFTWSHIDLYNSGKTKEIHLTHVTNLLQQKIQTLPWKIKTQQKKKKARNKNGRFRLTWNRHRQRVEKSKQDLVRENYTDEVFMRTRGDEGTD